MAIGAVSIPATYYKADIDDSSWHALVDVANDGFQPLPARQLLIPGQP